MNKNLCTKPVGKKDVVFYVARFGGRKDVSVVIVTKEPIQGRLREGLQEFADSKDLQPVFEGGVDIRRVHRIHVDTANIRSVGTSIKKRFRAISIDDLDNTREASRTQRQGLVQPLLS